MKTRKVQALAAVLMMATPCLVAGAPEARRPNIIVMLIDDLGYGDVGAFGCPDIPTPHIDTLARDGVRCLNGYTLMPVCSPSRAGLMTGLYPQRFRVNGNLNRGEPIPADHPTLAECLRDAGYITGMVGRWDLGDAQQGPLDRGFCEVARRPPGKPRVPGSPTYLGKDLLGQKTGDAHEALFWRWLDFPKDPLRAMRSGPWRLRLGKTDQLYHLADDPGETKDLASENPDKIAALKAMFNRWEQNLPAPIAGAKRNAKPQSGPPSGRGWAIAAEEPSKP